MTKNKIALVSILTISAATANATILAYEGFATDATGSGNNYTDETILDGVDESRTGYTGVWQAINEGLSTAVNADSIEGGLSYSGFNPGDPGMGKPFRTNTSTPSEGKWLGRDLTISNDGSYDSGYYVAGLVDFNSSSGGGFGWTLGNRENVIEYDGADATFNANGSVADDYSFTPSAGTNLIVIQYTDDTTGSPNTSFYTRWNLWVNPDLSSGDLPAITATGFGIGLLSSGDIGDFNNAFLDASGLQSQEMYVDELYIATEASDFITIPEPGTYALIVGIMAMGVFVRRSRI